MNKSKNEGSLRINEGAVKKGGVNSQPASTRPAPPAGQGGSSSSSQSERTSSSQDSSAEPS